MSDAVTVQDVRNSIRSKPSGREYIVAATPSEEGSITMTAKTSTTRRRFRTISSYTYTQGRDDLNYQNEVFTDMFRGKIVGRTTSTWTMTETLVPPAKPSE